MDVRPVRPNEYDRVGQLVVDAYRALPGGHLSGDYAAILADVGSRAGAAEVLVALMGDDDALVGSVTFVPGPGSAYAEHLEPGEAGVRMLAVAPKAQGRGVGRALVEACIGRAKAQQRTALMLHTTPWMTAAHHLYEASGFVRFPDRDWAPVADVQLLAYRFALS